MASGAEVSSQAGRGPGKGRGRGRGWGLRLGQGPSPGPGPRSSHLVVLLGALGRRVGRLRIKQVRERLAVLYRHNLRFKQNLKANDRVLVSSG